MTSEYDPDNPPIGIPQRNAWDALDLLDAMEASNAQEPTWLPLIGDTCLRKGFTYIIGAFPKVGKTELVTRAIAHWPAETVLYITEEAAETWGTRLLAMKAAGEELPVPGQLKLIHALTDAAEQGKDSRDIALAMLKATSASVVVVDTVREILHPEDENDNAKVSATIRPYVVAARRGGKTIVFLHHTTKRGGKGGRGISGATSFLGVVDGYLEILDGYVCEDDGPASPERTIRGRVRLGEVSTTYYKREENCFVVDDDAEPGKRRGRPPSNASETIFTWLESSPGWWTEAAIAATTSIPRRTVHDALVHLVDVEERVARNKLGRSTVYSANEEEPLEN